MNSFWKQIIINTVLRHKNKRLARKKQFTSFEIASGYRELKIVVRDFLRDVLLIGLGIIAAAFGLESFLLPNNFIDGGVTGISLLISELTTKSLSLFIVLIKIHFLILAFNFISRKFAIKASLAIIGLALALSFIQFPEVTHDKLLVAVFGGFFIGAGIGLSVRGGAVLDGTEVLAIFISRKIGATVGDIIIFINLLIFTAAAYFLSIETALYSLLTYLAASKTLDFVIEGIEEYTGVTIVSSHSEEIRQMVVEKMERGVTVYRGRRGFGRHGHTHEIDIVFTVITRLEINKLNTEIERIDPNAFVVMNSIKDTKGGMIKKHAFKH